MKENKYEKSKRNVKQYLAELFPKRDSIPHNLSYQKIEVVKLGLHMYFIKNKYNNY